MPLQPLFSPIYSSTRSYSQTRSNTQRALMQPDEIVCLESGRCIALFNHHKPALLYKLTPEELPGYADLKPCRVIDYVPAWKRREKRAARKKKSEAVKKKPPKAPEQDAPAEAKKKKAAGPPEPEREADIVYDLPDLHKQAQGTLGMVVERPAAGQAPGGMTEASLSDVLGGTPESEDDLPPGR